VVVVVGGAVVVVGDAVVVVVANVVGVTRAAAGFVVVVAAAFGWGVELHADATMPAPTTISATAIARPPCDLQIIPIDRIIRTPGSVSVVCLADLFLGRRSHSRRSPGYTSGVMQPASIRSMTIGNGWPEAGGTAPS
jgi:predicted nicotinamide N-methyase